MEYLDTSKVKHYRGTDFYIVPQGKGIYYYKKLNTMSHYIDVDYIDALSKKNISVPNMKSNILVIGLELGCIPHWLSTVCPLSNVDVVESNKELITAVKSMEYLPKKIEIIHDDIFSHTPTIKYDAIITDMWWEIDNDVISDIQILREHYNPYLKSNGKFHTPFIEPYIYKKITN